MKIPLSYSHGSVSRLVGLISCFSALALISQLPAQVGNDNPSGLSGTFNGNVTTGCSYDPYTGNATRSITDISVSGAVGQYPLALVRTYNSRNASYTSPFGQGGWNHSYNWLLEGSPTSSIPNFYPTSYTVDFPDGRQVTFTSSQTDPYFRGPAGVRERFVPLNLSTMLAYLILPDGGKVEFQAQQVHYLYGYYYSYTATGIIDPHGLRTTFTWDTYKRLTKATEPAGRYLQITYSSTSGFISQVTLSITIMPTGQPAINGAAPMSSAAGRNSCTLATIRCIPGQ
jgi:YD repeat-containing protein